MIHFQGPPAPIVGATGPQHGHHAVGAALGDTLLTERVIKLSERPDNDEGRTSPNRSIWREPNQCAKKRIQIQHISFLSKPQFPYPSCVP
jgi:hypothetical protein